MVGANYWVFLCVCQLCKLRVETEFLIVIENFLNITGGRECCETTKELILETRKGFNEHFCEDFLHILQCEPFPFYYKIFYKIYIYIQHI